MKKLVLFLMMLTVVSFSFAQEAVSITDPDPTVIGADSARQSLREVSVDLFEREGAWNASMSPDVGVISMRLFNGSPAGKEALPETSAEVTDEKVLGVKAEFFRRGVNPFYITAARPIAIEGITKIVSVWVAGRNQRHTLTLLVQDYFG
ncbi:MAG: flagellar filament protein FlaA, partial [Spirochaetaceae bacterium]|nr:flagellar filament protein FlaA [Spirochaetaceae bacterium]